MVRTNGSLPLNGDVPVNGNMPLNGNAHIVDTGRQVPPSMSTMMDSESEEEEGEGGGGGEERVEHIVVEPTVPSITQVCMIY